VIFELGFYYGHLGQGRVFYLADRGTPSLSLPSDIGGIAPLTFEGDRPDGNLIAAIGPAHTEFITQCRRVGPFSEHNNVEEARDRPEPNVIGRLIHDRVIGPIKGVVGQNWNENTQIYLAAPHRNVERNDDIRQAMETAEGIHVSLPRDLIEARGKSGAGIVRSVCSEAIRAANFVVVDLENYGLDSAWEIGFADALGIPVVGLYASSAGVHSPRPVHRRSYLDNFMHGWGEWPISSSLDEIAEAHDGQVIHVCGSFKNEHAMQAIRDSSLEDRADRLILPKDIIDLKASTPKKYRSGARDEAIRLLEVADVALVILPRYGMDTSWQIGYCAGTNKPVIGWLGRDYGPQVEPDVIWSHWMHNWKIRLLFQRVPDLLAYIVGRRSLGMVDVDLRDGLTTG
jgi:nucleoside 2-deoxyribosyltransferase